jgi:hypothetical protein
VPACAAISLLAKGVQPQHAIASRCEPERHRFKARFPLGAGFPFCPWRALGRPGPPRPPARPAGRETDIKNPNAPAATRIFE